MLNILLVKLEPICDRGTDSNIVSDNEYDVLVLDERLPFSVDREYYSGSTEFNAKVNEINQLLGLEYGGHVVAVDRYPKSSDHRGAEKTNSSGISRYTTNFTLDVSSYDLIILLCPDFERIVLAKLNFAYCGDAFIDGSGQITFSKKAVLSVKTFWGDFRGIALHKYSNVALDPETPNKHYALQFEEKQIPEAVLNKLL